MSHIPITLLTGFLGSGKTTLLNHVLADPALAETAVIINELGEIGLDHLLVRQVKDDVVLLDSGCLCCSVRSDLVVALHDLNQKRIGGEIAPFRRLVIETSGMADPAPILNSLFSDPLVAGYYQLDSVVTTVDSVLGLRQLHAQPEARKQAALADVLLLTKTDLVAAQDLFALESALRELNPGAAQFQVLNGHAEPGWLLDHGVLDKSAKSAQVEQWLNVARYRPAKRGGLLQAGHHEGDISSFSVTYDQPVPWPELRTALEVLAALHGAQLLRVKGIVLARGEPHPFAIHGVQHMLYAPVPLPQLGADQRQTQLVFITRAINPAFVRDTLEHFMATASLNP